MADTVSNIVKEQLDASVKLTTYDSTSYKKLGKNVKSHHAQVVKPEDLPKILPWVHIAIDNVSGCSWTCTINSQKSTCNTI